MEAFLDSPSLGKKRKEGRPSPLFTSDSGLLAAFVSSFEGSGDVSSGDHLGWISVKYDSSLFIGLSHRSKWMFES